MHEERKQANTIPIESPVLAKNREFAQANRTLLEQHGILAVNLIGSPGSGKTTLLEAMVTCLGDALAVIEGDVQTRRDTERIERAGGRACQIETRGACHLDAQQVGRAIQELRFEAHPCRVLVIENVGNLICPSGYDLGEHLKIAVLSVPEGDDKVLKYPSLFSRASVLVVNKVDLLPHVTFDVDRAVDECRSLNNRVIVFKTSGKTGEGVRALCDFLVTRRTELPPGIGK
jgi:hydrogenase nickel incorporation protein HypB